MIKIVNVSKRIIVIGSISIKPLKSVIFDYDNASSYIKNRINSLANIGLIKIYSYAMITSQEIQNTENIIVVSSQKKSNKKSK